MEDERKEKRILVLCVLGAVCVIVVAIITLIGIWTPEEKKKTEEKKQQVSDEIGRYNNISFSMDEQVEKYSEDIVSFLTTQNVDKIYEMTNPEYLDYFNLDKEGLKKVLSDKGFYGTVLTASKYNSTSIGTNKCFRLNLSSKNNNYVDGTVNIIEYSPNDYKIAFDRFIFYKKEPIKFIREDLEITISEQVAYDTMYNVTISITNNTNDTVYLNNGQAHEFIYLINTSGNEISSANNLYTGQKVEILKNKTVNMNLSFSLEDMSIGTIKSIKINGILKSKTGISSDIKLDI